jgi:hypothetical protein
MRGSNQHQAPATLLTLLIPWQQGAQPTRGRDVTTESDAEERHLAFLIKVSHQAAIEKAQSDIMRWVILVGCVLLVAWIVNENAWQRKLDLALSDCLTPMTDGSCPSRNPAYR